jgi:3-oxoacyl-(acyl-carrier-protein) synthase
MKRTRIALTGVGVATPRGVGMAAIGPACAAPDRLIPKQVGSLRLPADIKLQEQRRMDAISRLALYAAVQAVDAANVRGRDGALFVGLTHGSTSLLREFHDFLFDYGPELASPSAFSNGVTGAALGTVSKYLNLTLGGTTIVGYESCGLNLLSLVASEVDDGVYPFCVAGAIEEYSPLVEEVYRQIGWYGGKAPACLPMSPSEGSGFGMSEAAVFFTCEGVDRAAGRGCLFSPVDAVGDFREPVDLIISGAGGGPQDPVELSALRSICAAQKEPVPVLFSKPFFGETFAAGSLLSIALGWDILTNGAGYPLYRCHPDLAAAAGPGAFLPGTVRNVLVVAADRTGSVSAGMLSKAS